MDYSKALSAFLRAGDLVEVEKTPQKGFKPADERGEKSFHADCPNKTSGRGRTAPLAIPGEGSSPRVRQTGVVSSSSLVESNSLDDRDRERILDSLPSISLREVGNHDSMEDGWIVFYDRVYDLTDFVREHPGGIDVLLDYLGCDGTLAFRSVGHSLDALEMLGRFLIGSLPRKERAFTKSAVW